ncbi:hypothetical protein [Pseudonocardia sp. TRM90224]|uniref:hypothetical protein n=1 Tax=Pseudonocardia sp. TRM90224 TaxID=2812678 RepID=UPI001E62EDE1|nr:hypothetical protein [Pseudonocardia sp. TRM90224]
MRDPIEQYVHDRGCELRAAASEHRLAAGKRDADRSPSTLVRLYARIWWASRPRAAVWAPSLLDARS